MLAFRNAGVMRFVQGRRFSTYLHQYGYIAQRPSKPNPPRPVRPKMPGQDPLGRPRPRPLIMQMIESMKRLTPNEKLKFSYIFSELLELPKPPEESTKGKFAVKLVKFDPDKRYHVIRAVAWAKSTVKVMKSLSELGPSPSMRALENVPSVIREGVSKEEAKEIVAKIEAAGGVAVMEPSE